MNTPQINYIKAFTKDVDRGNPAVVIDGSFENEKVLMAIRNARCDVSALINTALGDTIPIRFFYENGEIETFACGHATLAAAHVVFSRYTDKDNLSFTNTNGIKIDIARFADGKISQEQTVPEFMDTEFVPEKLAEVFEINSNQIQRDLPIQLVGAPGKMKLMIPMTTEALFKLKSNFSTIRKFCEDGSTNEDSITGLFPFARNLDACDAHARHFPNRDQEDLVCGVGSLALASYLKHHLNLTKNKFIIRVGPGNKGMGEVIVRTEQDKDRRKIFIEGYAVEES